MASILDLHWLQPHRISAERICQQPFAIYHKGSIHMVDQWIRHHFHHCAGLCFAEIFYWKLCIYRIYQHDELAGWDRMAFGTSPSRSWAYRLRCSCSHGKWSQSGTDGLANQFAKVEEIPNPAVEGPRIMLACVAIGVFTGFIFLTCLLLVAGDVTNVIENAAGPLLAIFYNATGSKAGSICLLMYVPHHELSRHKCLSRHSSFPLVCLLFATITIMTTSSRMTYAFAR